VCHMERKVHPSVGKNVVALKNYQKMPRIVNVDPIVQVMNQRRLPIVKNTDNTLPANTVSPVQQKIGNETKILRMNTGSNSPRIEGDLAWLGVLLFLGCVVAWMLVFIKFVWPFL
jgi:hypothetical protein